jgi:hypothetical protein
MTSKALKLKVKATRAWRNLNDAAPYTQFCDGDVDIVTVDECEKFIEELKDIWEQQCVLIEEKSNENNASI